MSSKYFATRKTVFFFFVGFTQVMDYLTKGTVEKKATLSKTAESFGDQLRRSTRQRRQTASVKSTRRARKKVRENLVTFFKSTFVAPNNIKHLTVMANYTQNKPRQNRNIGDRYQLTVYLWKWLIMIHSTCFLMGKLQTTFKGQFSIPPLQTLGGDLEHA